MASVTSQKPDCPVCHQSDQVKTTDAAFAAGVAKAAPPELPHKQVYMLGYISIGAVVVGICVFLIVVLIGSEAALGDAATWILSGVTLVCIVGALVASYFAFQRVVHGDEQSRLYLPALDNALETWRGLYYCSRDDVVFNPQTNKVVSNDQLDRLRSLKLEQSTAAAPMAAHQ